MSLPLAKALAIASAYATPKGAGSYRCAQLNPGRIRATNGHGGVDIPCEAVTIDAIVDCTSLRKMVDAVGNNVVIRYDKKGSLKVVIEAGGTRYGIQSLKAEEAPLQPVMPTAGWRKLTPEVTRALGICAGMAGKDENKFALSGVRIGPHWFAGAWGQGLCIAWAAGVADAPITVPSGLFDGLEGEIEVRAEPNRFWIRELKTGQVRWSATIEGEWPDSVVDPGGVLPTARAEAARHTFSIDAAAVADLAAKADVVADGLGRTMRFSATKTAIVFAKQGKGSTGDAEFRGTVKIEGGPPTEIVVGMEPTPIGRACAAVAAACTVDDDQQMSITGVQSPVIVWGGSPMIEVLMMPFHLGGE